MNPEIIFRRTHKGTSALAGSELELSRIERQLLSVVNERVGMEIYARAFSAYGDANAVLRQLEQAGYVERVSDDLSRTQPIPQRDIAELNQQRSAQGGKSEWLSTLVGRRAPQQQPEANPPPPVKHDLRDLRDLRNFNAPPSQVPANAPVFAAQPAAVSQDAEAADEAARLNEAINEMAGFLQRNIGADSVDLIAVISQMQTVRELDAFLPRYEAGLMKRGIRADHHIELIDALLRQR
jgi:hypothetical protein